MLVQYARAHYIKMAAAANFKQRYFGIGEPAGVTLPAQTGKIGENGLIADYPIR